MKRIFTFFTLLLILLQISASAQGEWKWAHYWSGGDGSYGDYFNTITNTAFDEEGNIYVYGTMGGNPTIDGMTFQFTQAGSVLSYNDKTIMLAKFDTLGNMLWYKVVKNSSILSLPHWMEIKNNHIFISGNCMLDAVDYPSSMNNVWLYYLDTLIRGSQVHTIPVENRRPPFKAGMFTFFSELDTEGNVIENHFVEAFSREILDTVSGEQTLTFFCDGLSSTIAPFHIDNEGNIILFSQIYYTGNEDDPYTIIIDGDSNKKYDFYFPGNTNSWLGDVPLYNAMIYKFSPSWELLYAKSMVESTDGIATSMEITGDSINPRYIPNITGLSFDDNDNMYITGYIQLVMYVPEMGAETHHYPIHINFDDSHNIVIQDITSAEYCNFVIKYDPQLNVLWCNQMHSNGGNSPVYGSARGTWYGSVTKENSLYILGTAAYNDGSLIYFDEPSNPLIRYQDMYSGVCFFVRYDATTGHYMNQGIVPAMTALSSKFPAIINNRIFALTQCNSTHEYWMAMWRNDGLFIKADTLYAPDGIAILKSVGVCSKENGDIIVSVTAKSPLLINDNFSINCPSNHSSAVVAYYYDPSLAEPLPEDSTGIAEHSVKVNVRLWPNPATDKITIESEDAFPIKSVCIADIQGTIVGILPVDDTRCTLNVSNLSAGTYIAHVETKAGISDCKFVVKK